MKSLQSKVNHLLTTESFEVDSSTNEDLCTLMKKWSSSALSSCTDNSFCSLFWQQQLKAASVKNSRGMTWHPLIVKWCLYLQYRSSGAYEALRSSGVIKLPSGRTLRDYKHFAPAVTGFSAEYDCQLINLAEKTSILSKYVALLVDEMYVKEGLVFNKHSGQLIGFVDLGDFTTRLLEYEHQLRQQHEVRQVAKSIVVFMVRGLLTDIQFPYATFPASSPKGCDLFALLWNAIERLTRLDFVC